jgi:RimJ/RimL family protein N-acetyltransferase
MAALMTDRLILRRWCQEDRAPFAAMNADPRVMEFMPKLLSREESDHMIDRIEAGFEQRDFGLYATQLRLDSSFIGFIGLSVPAFEATFTPCVEIGWRLASRVWNRGLATEGARAVIGESFGRLGLSALVSFTAKQNAASQRVMQKLGMTRNPAEDFDHPNLAEGHPLRRHVLYRLRA